MLRGKGRTQRRGCILAVGRRTLGVGLLMTCGLASAGCMRSLWNDFLDPSEVGRFYGKPVTKEIRATLGLQDEEAETINATEPLPEDTVAVLKDYQIGPGDWIEVTIHELIRAGSITTETRKVTDLGYVNLPVIGSVKVGGLTEKQAEDVIKAKLKPDLLPDPIVGVVVRTEQQRHFTIVGYVTRPGPVVLPKLDFRMLEAISYAGQLPEEVESVYVIRRCGKATDGPAPTSLPSSEPAVPSGTSSKPSEAPTSSAAGTLREGVDLLLADLGGSASAPGWSPHAATGTTNPSLSAPSSRRTEITPDERREFIQAIVPGSSAPATGRPDSGANPTAVSQDATQELSKWIWLNGEWVEVKGEPTRQSQSSQETRQTERPATEGVEWDTVSSAGEEVRIIGIPLNPLRAGEARYNIVIRPGDVISIPSPEAGKRYYVMGHVRGPGAYAIPIEGITLRAAIAASGGLDPYAWPSRCEIARRIAGDQYELHQVDLDRIFAMKDPDIKLKAGDVINIGTHPLSPFMVTIANGFRTTYGFGFVYDRNFADIDSFGGQQNPRDRRRSEQNSRFPALESVFPGL